MGSAQDGSNHSVLFENVSRGFVRHSLEEAGKYLVPLMQAQKCSQQRTVNIICNHLELEELVAVVTPEISPSLPPRGPWPLLVGCEDYIYLNLRLKE